MLIIALALVGATVAALLALRRPDPSTCRRAAWLVLIIVPAIVLVRVLLAPRADPENGVVLVDPDAVWVQVVQVLTAFALTASAWLIAGWWALRHPSVVRLPVLHPVGGAAVWAAAMAITALTTPAASLAQATIYLPVLALAFWAAGDVLGWAGTRRFTIVLGSLVAVGSLASLAIDAQWARGGAYLQREMVEPRLFGLAEHPSMLFPTVLALLAMTVLAPGPLAPRILLALPASACLLLGNVVTGWLCLIVLSLFWLFWAVRDRQVGVRSILGAGVVVLAGTVFVLVLGDELDAFAVGTRRLETLSGRDIIWPAALAAFADRPVAGHGLEAFRDPAFGQYYNVSGFAHAHNQVLDALVQGGLLLAAALAVFVICLLAGLRRAAPGPAARFAVCLVAIVAVHAATERPLQIIAVDNRLLFLLWMLLAIAAAQPGAGGWSRPDDAEDG